MPVKTRMKLHFKSRLYTYIYIYVCVCTQRHVYIHRYISCILIQTDINTNIYIYIHISTYLCISGVYTCISSTSQLQPLPVRISHSWDEDPKTLRRGVGRGKSTIRSVGELKDGVHWGRWGGLVSNWWVGITSISAPKLDVPSQVSQFSGGFCWLLVSRRVKRWESSVHVFFW